MNHLPLPYNLNELYGSQMTKFNGAFPVSHAAQRGRFLAEQTQYVSERQVDLLRMRPEEWQTCRYNTHYGCVLNHYRVQYAAMCVKLSSSVYRLYGKFILKNMKTSCRKHKVAVIGESVFSVALCDVDRIN